MENFALGLRKKLSSTNPVPDDGITSAVNVMKAGNMYRYTCSVPEESEVALFERDFARYTGAKFALGVNSCGSALYIALLAVGVKPGDHVLLSAFTYTAVPSAIVNANAVPVLVGCNKNYGVDIKDLKQKITNKTKIFVLSHMRGHVSDMDEVVTICKDNNIVLIEDCAHAVGARYKNKHTGRFGKIGCFSTQSHKMMNSGEGGILITDDEEIIAKAILYSGSQEKFWERHFVKSSYLPHLQEKIPNISVRMSSITAVILRSQIPHIDRWVKEYIEKYNYLVGIISKSKFIYAPQEDENVHRGPDTIQFNIRNISEQGLKKIIALLESKGIIIKVFGSKGNPRNYRSWKYIDGIERISLPETDNILKFACDLRLPLGLTKKDIEYIGVSIFNVVQEIAEEERLSLVAL